MQNYFDGLLHHFEPNRLFEQVETLWRKELPQTSAAHMQAAKHALQLLQQAGLEQAEIIEFPADGKTVYQDKCMPLAWEASMGRLTISKSPLEFEDPVVADYQRHPFHLVKGSVAPPGNKAHVRIITETQLFAGVDTQDALLVCAAHTNPGSILKTALDLGVMGLISDYYAQPARRHNPEAIGWINACTETPSWHVAADERDFICFSVSAKQADKIRNASEIGELNALIECDARRYVGVLPGVTALIPGRQKKEFWILAHLFEPLSDDNSTGVVAAIEIAKAIKNLSAEGKLPALEFSIRLLFGAELYGFAAFAEHFGGRLRDKTIGAVNLDSLMAGNPEQRLHVYAAAPATPFFGNAILEIFLQEYAGHKEAFQVDRFVEAGNYSDDTFMADSSVGLPTVWFIGREKRYWHNSSLTMQTIDRRVFARCCASIAAWIARLLCVNQDMLAELLPQAGAQAMRHLAEEYSRILTRKITGPEAEQQLLYRLQIDQERLADFSQIGSHEQINKQIELVQKVARQYLEMLGEMPRQPARSGTWFDYVDSVVPARNTRGFPHDLAKLPPSQRKTADSSGLYGPLARILANMDGKKSLQRLILETEWELNSRLSEADIKKYLGKIIYLEQHGYLKAEYKRKVEQSDIVTALKKLGLRQGDCVFLHSSASAFGYLQGGEKSVIDAFLQVIGAAGTLLLPCFTTPFNCFEGSINKNRRYQPYDAEDPAQVRVGLIAQAFLAYPGVYRSAHPSHSVAGLGPLAQDCLQAQREDSPPCAEDSAFAKLVEHKGKIVYFGCGLAPSTFLHYLETKAALPYLGGSLCTVREPEGGSRAVYVPKNLPGHRDFYLDKNADCKFFRAATARGLLIDSHVLGCGKLQLIEAEAFNRIGLSLIKEQPDILLCEQPDCLFCRKHKRWPGSILDTKTH
ncbi:MAG: AAC(3) family N-acetyltransferase [Lentisphaeria bacterium]|nr:AAC(3) family N-acetyltransferase [Lentisphaeria bacterium]